MRRDKMNRLLRIELERVPRGSLVQNEFRMVYAIERRHDLAADATTDPHDSFARALESVRSRHPSFVPELLDAASQFTGAGLLVLAGYVLGRCDALR